MAKVGRPKGSKDRAQRVREWAAGVWVKYQCDEKIGAILDGEDIRAQTSILIKLLEYQHGKPIQPISGENDGPIAVRLITNVKLPHE